MGTPSHSRLGAVCERDSLLPATTQIGHRRRSAHGSPRCISSLARGRETRHSIYVMGRTPLRPPGRARLLGGAHMQSLILQWIEAFRGGGSTCDRLCMYKYMYSLRSTYRGHTVFTAVPS